MAKPNQTRISVNALKEENKGSNIGIAGAWIVFLNCLTKSHVSITKKE